MRPALLREAAASPPHYKSRRPVQTTLERLVQQHFETFAVNGDRQGSGGADLPRFVKDNFDAYPDCGILAHGFTRSRCDGCMRDERP